MTDEEFKMDVVDRLARIETNIETWTAKKSSNRLAIIETKLKTWGAKISLNRYLILFVFAILAGAILKETLLN